MSASIRLIYKNSGPIANVIASVLPYFLQAIVFYFKVLYIRIWNFAYSSAHMNDESGLNINYYWNKFIVVWCHF